MTDKAASADAAGPYVHAHYEPGMKWDDKPKAPLAEAARKLQEAIG